MTIREVKLNITSSLVVENTSQFFHRITACVERERTSEFEIRYETQRKNNNLESAGESATATTGNSEFHWEEARISGVEQILIILLVDYLFFTW